MSVGAWVSGALAVVTTTVLLKKFVFKPSVAKKFQNKRVVLTGASSGIGEALAFELASYNAELCLVARRKERLESLQQELNKKYPKCKSHVIVADISEKEQCKHVIEKSVNDMGGIDVLLLNAGIGCLIRLDALPESDLNVCENVMTVNYFANVYLSYYAVPHLQESKGMIIVNSSLAGIGWSPGRCFYSASKHALRGFFNSLRCEVGDKVQITIVYPGFVLSEIHDKAYHESGKTLQRGKGFMTAERCSQLILRGATNGARDYCMTWLGSFALKCNPFMGTINDYIAIRKAKAGISQ